VRRNVVSDEWLFPRITDFWEYRTKAVLSGAEQLEDLSEHDRKRSLFVLGERVRAHMRNLDDGSLVYAAWIMAEDLYKSLFGEFWWSDDVEYYIAGSAGVFIHELAQRGFVLHYVIDNSATEAQLPVFLTYVPAIFRAAGMFVTGPQLAALDIMENQGRPRDMAAIPAVPIALAKTLADGLVTRCHEERYSYLFLNLELIEAESAGVSFDVALSKGNEPGTIVVFRQEPPVAGTNAKLYPPQGVTLPG
jgi:hypothetical protein